MSQTFQNMVFNSLRTQVCLAYANGDIQLYYKLIVDEDFWKRALEGMDGAYAEHATIRDMRTPETMQARTLPGKKPVIKRGGLTRLPSGAKLGKAVDAVVAQVDRRAAEHHCHAKNCKTKCKPEYLMCGKHWALVPDKLQKAVYAHYRIGQCEDMNPSEAWHKAADAAISYVFQKEQGYVVPFVQGTEDVTDQSTPFDTPIRISQTYTKEELRLKVKRELEPICAALGIEGYERLSPDVLRTKILMKQEESAAGEHFVCPITGLPTPRLITITENGVKFAVGERTKDYLDVGWTVDQILNKEVAVV